MTRPRRLDDVDLQIIRSLQKDGRRAYVDIAADLNLAPSTVQQRVNRLMEDGMLEVRAVTDPLAMGVPVTATIAIEVDGARLVEIANALTAFEEIGWVAICTGSYDLLTEIACQDNDDLIRLLTEISGIAGVRSTETFMYLRIVKNTYQWGIPKAL